MKIITRIILIYALLLICSCTAKKAGSIKRLQWLTGTWEQTTSKGSIYETWQKVNRNELRGKSYMIKNKDTIVFETIRLVQEQDRLFYIPVVRNQNDGAPVRFEGKTTSENQLVFENRLHDFPQAISYKMINADSLMAEISGLRNGQEDRRYFRMKRIR